ncbi:LytR family transcriptional regulator [Nocardioides sp. GY 10113]|uniref:LCP family protein n=1 Tax=Nocardioides sp. GY 10113 TaxID=2569761 RepID=UPI0010A83A80|nr:LCP family protein [Nocardioides sp. GY 10113]TIC83227.1 LytR family transcriptional regulator [Nocardioides sp. GY 10113]
MVYAPAATETDVTSATRRRSTALGVAALVSVAAASRTPTFLVWGRQQLPPLLHSEPAFVGLGDRPQRADGGAGAAMNILLVGTDLPGTDASGLDTTTLLHLAADRRSVEAVSIPTASWVRVPGRGHAALDTAYDRGGLPLLVRTLEDLTDVHIDHVAVVGWPSIASLVDALGGIEVTVPEASEASAGPAWPPGRQTLDGDATLRYVGVQSPGDALKDVRRQQVVLRQLVQQTLVQELHRQPKSLVRIVRQLLTSVAVDERWTSLRLLFFAASLWNLRTNDIRFVTAPITGSGDEGARRVVYLARRRGAELWRAVRADRADTWLIDHPGAETPWSVQ